MIETIRASKLFSLVPERHAKDRIVRMKIPIRRVPDQPDYSLKLLELMVLTACIRITNARRMFEFGTFLGNTTLHMALNSPDDSEIWTLDADDETLQRLGFLDVYHWRKLFPFEFEDTEVESRVRVLRADSHTFDPERLSGTMDLVLIDGDHTPVGITTDTNNAVKLLRDVDNCCILWHDYDPSDKDCADVVAYLNGIQDSSSLVRIEDTKLVLLMRKNGVCPLK